MKTYIISALILVGFMLANGCISSNSPNQETMSSSRSSQTTGEEKKKLVSQYLETGQAYEQQGRLNSALEQYALALTVLPDNAQAATAKKEVTSKLKDKAQLHYQQGMAYDKNGQYEAARKEYLSALQNWPDHSQAKERLTPGGVADGNREYIIHTLRYGESVSKVSLIYYGTLKKHEIIGKFNILKDAKKVRVGQKLKVPVIKGISLADLKERQTTYLEGPHPESSAASLDMTDDEQPALTEETTQESPLTNMDSLGETEPEQDKVIGDYESMTAADSLDDSISDAMDPEPSNETQISEAKPIEEQDKTPPPIQDATKTASIEPQPSPSVPAPENSTEALSDKQKSPEASDPIEQDPVDVYQLGIEQFKKKEYSKAIDNFTQALEKTPDDEILRDYLFQSHFQNGLNLYKKSKYLNAKDNFSQALAYNPACEKCQENIQKSENSYKEKHYNLGIHYFGKENLKKAISEWKKVQKIDPTYKEVAPNLKKAELLSKRLEAIKQSSSN